jgi:hypothetical protein
MAVTIIGTNVAGDRHEYDPEKWVTRDLSAVKLGNGTNGTTESHLPTRHPETGIDVLVVGAGMGGLMTTLECWRKGHNVIGILERNNGPVYSGKHCLPCATGLILLLTVSQEISSSYSLLPSQY